MHSGWAKCGRHLHRRISVQKCRSSCRVTHQSSKLIKNSFPYTKAALVGVACLAPLGWHAKLFHSRLCDLKHHEISTKEFAYRNIELREWLRNNKLNKVKKPTAYTIPTSPCSCMRFWILGVSGFIRCWCPWNNIIYHYLWLVSCCPMTPEHWFPIWYTPQASHYHLYEPVLHVVFCN